MKHIFTLAVALGCLCQFTGLKAQVSSDSVYLITDQMPDYPGGIDSLRAVLAKTVVYPQQCTDSGIQGKVFLRFVVNEDGSIGRVQALKGPHPLLDSAAVEAVRKLGKFTPGLQQGKPVRVYYTLPVVFKLDEPEKTSFFDFYPGGVAAFDSLVNDSLIYPPKARERAIEANITVVCKLNDRYKLAPVSVENSIDSSFDEEAMRLVRLMKPCDAKIAQTSYATHEISVKITFELPMAGSLNNYFTLRRASTEYDGLGVEYYKQNNYEKALEYFDAAISAYPRDADAWFNRGIAKTKLNTGTPCADFVRAYLLGVLEAGKGIEQNCGEDKGETKKNEKKK